MKSLLLAIQFLTVIPVRVGGDVRARDMAASVGAYPVVGLLLGMVLVAGDMALNWMFPPALATGLLVVVLILMNAGFHLDGLADTFDGLATPMARQGEGTAAPRDFTRKHAAMSDSATGAVGVVAVVCALMLKYLALSEATNFPPVVWYMTLVMMPLSARWAQAVGMYAGVPAKPTGLGAMVMQELRGRHIAVAALCAAGVPVLAWVATPMVSVMDMGFALAGLAFMTVLTLMLVRFFRLRLGGLTGDTMGATAEVVEIAFLLYAHLWQRILYTGGI